MTATTTSRVYTTRFGGDRQAVRRILDAAGLAALLEREAPHQVLLKPNVVNESPPPITTPAWVVAEVALFVRETLSDECKVVVADGTGEVHTDTMALFRLHGYLDEIPWAEFVDLNHAPTVQVELPHGRRWNSMELPAVVFDSFLISIPVLKAHSLAGVTLTMKNMIGICPPSRYQQGGHWKKSAFHHRIDASIFDLNQTRTPDFTLLDATVGMAEYHLGGPECEPPVDRFVASSDPVALDAYACSLLGRNWKDIGHIRLADGVLGSAFGFELVEVA